MFILATIKDVIRIEPHKFAEEHVAVGRETDFPNTCVDADKGD